MHARGYAVRIEPEIDELIGPPLQADTARANLRSSYPDRCGSGQPLGRRCPIAEGLQLCGE